MEALRYFKAERCPFGKRSLLDFDVSQKDVQCCSDTSFQLRVTLFPHAAPFGLRLEVKKSENHQQRDCKDSALEKCFSAGILANYKKNIKIWHASFQLMVAFLALAQASLRAVEPPPSQRPASLTICYIGVDSQSSSTIKLQAQKGKSNCKRTSTADLTDISGTLEPTEP